MREAVEYFRNEQIYFLQLIGFMSYRGSVQMAEILEEKFIEVLISRLANKKRLSDIEKVSDIFNVPLYESIIAKEKKDALKLSIGFSSLDLKEQERIAAAHKSMYEWLSFHWLVGTPPTIKEVRNRLLKLSETASDELRQIRERNKKERAEIKKNTKELGLNAKEKRLLNYYRTWLFLRTHVKDSINLAGYKLLFILNHISHLVGIPEITMPYLTIQEILNIESLSKDEIKKKILTRKSGFSAGIISGVFSFGRFKKNTSNKENAIAITKISGSIAFKGILTGTARVLESPKEQNNLRDGEILVTSMTTPDFLPAMERASAFITDEGGITCHAAIVAREMQKPCIIGTKNATKIIKSGNLIEVDANKGIVKILKNR